MRRLLLAALLALLVAPAAGENATPAPDEAPLRIATEGAYPPFNYVENGEPAGFEVELGRALCREMGRRCTFVLQDWDGMLSGLKAGTFDAIMSSMERTKKRRARVAFSRPYYRIPAALIGPKGEAGKPFSLSDLAGKSVGAVADTEFAAWLQQVPEIGAVRLFNKLEEANLDLLTGRLDYVLGDKLALSRFLDSREGATCCRFVADLPVPRGPGIGIAVRPADSALAEAFDAAIGKLMADGRYDRIRARFIPFDVK